MVECLQSAYLPLMNIFLLNIVFLNSKILGLLWLVIVILVKKERLSIILKCKKESFNCYFKLLLIFSFQTAEIRMG